MKKKGNKRMPTPKQKIIHNPHLCFFSIVCKILQAQLIVYTNKQRCRDGVMNEFWCKDPLVPLLFHEVTSLHPPSFHFPLV